MNKILASLISTALLLSACTTINHPPGPTPPPPGPNQAGVVQGIALDTKGRPIAGAKVWISPAQTTGLVQTTTDSNGRYSTKVMPNLPYYAYAWHWVQYREKEVCLRLAPEKIEGNDGFVPQQGAVRNFVWKIRGAMGREFDGYYGGEVRLFGYQGEGTQLEFTFVPDGPLVDGSTGKVFTHVYNPEKWLLEDIPLGAYIVSAVLTRANGSRMALKVSTEGMYVGMGDTALLEWKTGPASCVGSTGNGVTRAFIWVESPPEE